MATDCIFCKIAAGEIPGDFVYRDDNVFVIRDIAPKAPVHLLVIPIKHFEALTNLTPDDHGMVGAMLQAAKEAARSEGVAEGGYRLVINQGENGRQDVAHLHMHVMGGKRLGAMG
jgi:histidine triad (HIT) family protein